MKAINTPLESTEFALEDFLPYRLSLLSNTVSQGIARSYRQQFGLSVTEWRVVAVLGRFPGLAASEITQRTAMDKVAISRAVKRLLDRDLVERTAHDEDRRRMPLRLTPGKGRALYKKVVPKALDYERRFLSALTEDELSRFHRMVRKLQCRAEALNSEE
jgi:DNA-binding MarR family transcriptional regulator